MNLRFFLIALSFFPVIVLGNDILRLGSSTSAENSGLLDQLLPVFEKQTGLVVEVQSVGSGNALRLGRSGKVDVVLVHLRPAELKFMQEGYGLTHREIMKNDFIIVGPEDDPANIKGYSDVLQALLKIAASQAPFVSRGDNSGTYRREMKLWQAAGIDPYGQSWYLEMGLGMGASLNKAGEMGAYIITDRGTWLAYRKNIPLVVMTQGDKRLENIYSVITVNPKRHPKTNQEAAEKFADWLVSEPAQKIISELRVDGEILFTPLAVSIKTAH